MRAVLPSILLLMLGVRSGTVRVVAVLAVLAFFGASLGNGWFKQTGNSGIESESITAHSDPAIAQKAILQSHSDEEATPVGNGHVSPAGLASLTGQIVASTDEDTKDDLPGSAAPDNGSTQMNSDHQPANDGVGDEVVSSPAPFEHFAVNAIAIPTVGSKPPPRRTESPGASDSDASALNEGGLAERGPVMRPQAMNPLRPVIQDEHQDNVLLVDATIAAILIKSFENTFKNPPAFELPALAAGTSTENPTSSEPELRVAAEEPVKTVEQRASGTERIAESANGSSRRKGNAAAQATQNDAVDLASLIVIGIVGKDDDRTAILRSPSGKVIKLKKDSRFSGGRVIAVRSNSLVVARGGKSVVLPLEF